MQKTKFELTPDLVKIEKELISNPEAFLGTQSIAAQEKILTTKKVESKEQINLKISSKIKKEFKVWCIRNTINMTDALELAIRELISYPRVIDILPALKDEDS
ncbi:hypothetical protein FACS1894122_08400 [Alphaproteobacteria bacterium]|nr:hypothetical protein FACS1894122_08400 [Alphaproteobacteria bacterium]